jgi:hypothetical protein
MGKYGVTANSIAPRASTRMISAIPDSGREARAKAGVSSLSSKGEITTMDPDAIAPFVTYLASDHASTINGHTFLVFNGEISLLSQPRPIKSIVSNGPWKLDELAKLSREYLTREIYNPAPVQNREH